MPAKDIGLAVLVQVIWGVGFTLMKPTMSAFPPLLFIALVYGIIALVATPLVPGSRTPFGWMMLIAALGGSAQSCLLAFGLTMLPATTSNLLLQLTVPFAVLMSWAARIDRPRLRNGLGCVVALAGVAIVIGAPGAGNSWLGVVMIAVASLAWSAAQILIRLRCSDSGATFYAAMARHACPQALIASLMLERGQLGWLARAAWQDWGALIAIALCGFAGGYMLWYKLLVRNRIDQLLPFSLLMPPVGVATGVLYLGESLRYSLLTGGAVILAGLAVIVWPARRAMPVRQDSS
ncbi:MAG TPA: DMT family transporter [Dongiaceae bacterium]|jgi:O-acetylserine/cysteine efflux transporter|nr:DMT family transporter [Dongiaceae bacterium]